MGRGGSKSKYSPLVHKEAVSMATILQSSDIASSIVDVPARTIRDWVQTFREMGDSELDAYICQQKRIAGGLWAYEQVEALKFAQMLRTADRANEYKAAIIAAGVCGTKLESLGQPKDVTPSPPASPSLLREIPGLPNDPKP